MYYDAPSLNQTSRLIEDFNNPVITHLVNWGLVKLEKGDIAGLTNGLWTKGRFSEFIELALKDKLEAERVIIHAMATDFIRDHLNKINK